MHHDIFSIFDNRYTDTLIVYRSNKKNISRIQLIDPSNRTDFSIKYCKISCLKETIAILLHYISIEYISVGLSVLIFYCFKISPFFRSPIQKTTKVKLIYLTYSY